MVKKVRQTMVLTVIETWTIAWADGTAHTITYRTQQFYQPLPSTSDDPQSGTNLEAKKPDPDQGDLDAGSGE